MIAVYKWWTSISGWSAHRTSLRWSISSIVYPLSTSSYWRSGVPECRNSVFSTSKEFVFMRGSRPEDVLETCSHYAWRGEPGPDKEKCKQWLRQLLDYASCGHPASSYVCLRSYKLASDHGDTISRLCRRFQLSSCLKLHRQLQSQPNSPPNIKLRALFLLFLFNQKQWFYFVFERRWKVFRS